MSSPTALRNALVPGGFCPFAPDDDSSEAVPCLLPALAAILVGKRGGTSIRITDHEIRGEIPKRARQYRNLMHGRHKAGLVGKIGAVIDILLDSDEEFREQAAQLERGVQLSAVQDVGNARKRLIKKHEEQARISSFS